MDHLEPPSMGEIMDIVDRRRTEARRRSRVAFAGVAVGLIAATGVGLRSLAVNDTTEAGPADRPSTTAAPVVTATSPSSPSPSPTTVETEPTPTTTVTSSNDPPSTSDETTTTTATTSESVPSSQPTTAATDPAQLLIDFADTWRRADWAAMAELATPAVVGTAQEWHNDGDDGPQIDAENIATVLDACFATGETQTRCEFLYAANAPDGSGAAGLLFTLTYTGDGTGQLTITGLDFGGDAG